MPRRGTIRNRGIQIDPDSGNEVPGPVVDTPTRAWLSQKSTTDLSHQTEINTVQATVRSVWTLLVPVNAPLSSTSQYLDEQGRVYEVMGDVALRPDHRPTFRAALLQLTSDLSQEP